MMGGAGAEQELMMGGAGAEKELMMGGAGADQRAGDDDQWSRSKAGSRS